MHMHRQPCVGLCLCISINWLKMSGHWLWQRQEEETPTTAGSILQQLTLADLSTNYNLFCAALAVAVQWQWFKQSVILWIEKEAQLNSDMNWGKEGESVDSVSHYYCNCLHSFLLLRKCTAVTSSTCTYTQSIEKEEKFWTVVLKEAEQKTKSIYSEGNLLPRWVTATAQIHSSEAGKRFLSIRKEKMKRKKKEMLRCNLA